MNSEKIFKDKNNSKISDSNLFGKFKHQWVEENFSHYKVHKKEIKISETKSFIGSSLIKKKSFFILSLMILGILVIFGRVIYLQGFKGKHYLNLAENNRVRIKPIPSERGVIYDKNKKQLTENIPSFLLSVIPQDLPQNEEKRNKVIEQIAKLSEIDEKEITNLINKYSAYSYEYLTIKDNLSYDTALKLYIENANLPGIIIEKGTKRLYYNFDENEDKTVHSLSHIIGYLGKINESELSNLYQIGYLPSDYLGKDGIEKQFESVLRGEYGRKKIEVNALGKEQNVLAEEPPIPGNNLVLSIDFEAQKKLEEIILDSFSKNKWEKAAAIAINPKNGDILALVSLPAYDNNDFSGGISQEKYEKYRKNPNSPLFNRVIGGTYPSGSIIKPIIAAAALEEKIITKNTSFLSTGGIAVDRWFFRDWQAGGHGTTNVTKAIAWSVNTFFYYIGGGYKTFMGLGADKIIEYLKKFNLSNKTGIDLPGENSGFVPSRSWKEEVKEEMWYVGDTYNLSIGQGDLLVTPLQAVIWTSAIANGGKIIKPRLVTSIINSVDKKEYPIEPEVINNGVISEYNMNIVKQGMRECVNYGSCKLLQNLPFSSGGKTGTAQWSSNKDNHAWFISFAPFNNPEIALVVLVEEGEEGSTAAMPIAYEFLKWWGVNNL